MKKGFTIVELLVSITLISIILVSMISVLLRLKDTYSLIYGDVEIRTYSSLISKVINEHILKNNGVKNITCSEDGYSCILQLGNNKSMSLKIVLADHKFENIYENNRIVGVSEVKTTTLMYYDNETNGEEYSYYKTLKYYVKTYDNGNVFEDGNIFLRISSTIQQYDNLENNSLLDTLINISVELNNPKYNIELYGNSIVDKETLIRVYTLIYNCDYGNCSYEQKLEGDTWSLNCNPTRENYSFKGWYDKPSFGNKILSGNIVNGNKYVYCQWSP